MLVVILYQLGKKIFNLNALAKNSFNSGNIKEAKKYANELLILMTRYGDNWNYGNAVQDSNLVLGRIAVYEGRIEDAKIFY